MFYLEYIPSKRPVKSIVVNARFDNCPFTTDTTDIEDARMFSRKSDAIRCKNYWEFNLSVRTLDPWGHKIELYEVKELPCGKAMIS